MHTNQKNMCRVFVFLCWGKKNSSLKLKYTCNPASNGPITVGHRGSLGFQYKFSRASPQWCKADGLELSIKCKRSILDLNRNQLNCEINTDIQPCNVLTLHPVLCISSTCLFLSITACAHQIHISTNYEHYDGHFYLFFHSFIYLFTPS